MEEALQDGRPQYARALDKANAVRLARSAAHRRVKELPVDEGRRALADLLREMPWWIGNATVGNVLDWPHRTGRKWIGKAVEYARVPEYKELGKLTERQRFALIYCLEEGNPQNWKVVTEFSL